MERGYDLFERKQLLLDTMWQQSEVHSVFDGLKILLKIEIINNKVSCSKQKRSKEMTELHGEEKYCDFKKEKFCF